MFTNLYKLNTTTSGPFCEFYLTFFKLVIHYMLHSLKKKSLAIIFFFFNPSNSLALNPTTKAAHIACEKLMKSLSCMVFTEIDPPPTER